VCIYIYTHTHKHIYAVDTVVQHEVPAPVNRIVEKTISILSVYIKIIVILYVYTHTHTHAHTLTYMQWTR